jgi:hypothetical protein
MTDTPSRPAPQQAKCRKCHDKGYIYLDPIEKHGRFPCNECGPAPQQEQAAPVDHRPRKDRQWTKAEREEVRLFLGTVAVFPFHDWAKHNGARAKALLEKLK